MNPPSLTSMSVTARGAWRDVWTGRTVPGIAATAVVGARALAPAHRAVPRTAPPRTAPCLGANHDEVRQLHHGARLRGVMRSDRSFRVESGRVWITLSGDVRDHFVGAGQSVVLQRDARFLIEADGIDPVWYAWSMPAATEPSAGRSRLLLIVRARASRSRPAGDAEPRTWGRTIFAALRTRWHAWCVRGAARKAQRQLLDLSDARLDDIGAPESLRAAARGHRRAILIRREIDRMMIWR